MRKFKLHSGVSGTALTIRVTPRARRTEVAGMLEDGTIRIRVAAPPVEGKANEELLDFLSKALRIRRNRIEVIVGEKGLDKLVSIRDLTPGQAHARLSALLEKSQEDG
ncbi:MAG: DUF167 domain-containing protein [Anaerolineales bacterium]|nr:DUF167 domain-containing protein [Anaerolineales bacterium]